MYRERGGGREREGEMEPCVKYTHIYITNH